VIAFILAVALVADQRAVLRAAPRDSAAAQAQLARGDWLEVRGEVPGWLKVYDHRRERPGFVRPGQVRVHDELRGPELRAVLRFLRDAVGQESLTIAYAALWMKTGEAEGAAEVNEAIGVVSERLASRLSERADSQLSGQRDVAESYGVRIDSVERDGRVVACYDGAAFRTVLALADATAAQRARAALALTSGRCVDPASTPSQLAAWNEWRLDVLAKCDPAAAPAPLGDLVRLRRAEALSWLAWHAARTGTVGGEAATQAMRELRLADRGRLPEDERAPYEETALRVAASRWAAEPPSEQKRLAIRAGRPGETCLTVASATRCTYGQVWMASATASSNAVAVAVQPLASWTELWVFHRRSGKWRVDVLAPATEVVVGYVDAAGFSPDGRRLLVVREAMVRGRLIRKFQVLRSDTLRIVAQSSRAESLSAFAAWSSAAWHGSAVALR
jgi:hypothetical protein